MTIDRENLLGKLHAGHTFPGSFSFKAIGTPTPSFHDALLAAVRSVLGGEAAIDVSVRHSREGKHAAYTLRAHCAEPADVVAVYGALRQVSGLKLLL